MTGKQRRRKDDSDGRFARLAKALSSPRRLELLDALAQCPRTVENLANQTGMTMANASQHLQVLREPAWSSPRRTVFSFATASRRLTCRSFCSHYGG
jgi:predicted transcriptional regulator